ncbi:signal peptidase II [Martelella endophytica]|uniref:Lipoprotein signal peptidase n=1 Tax=Martelella endophytica TaxID=1486262 RepID=A0A0D5LUE0_MAREN|nr:signal peptidase II [Martelella endophytica]AJY47362.1 lipoprotein signal peptidase [Martelella endophytica]
MTSPLSRPFPAVLFVIVAVLLDAAVKYAVEIYLPLQQPIDVIPFLGLYKTYNPGIAFSMLSDTNGWGLVGLRLVIVAVVLWLWRRTAPGQVFAHFGFALVVAGAFGNIIDHFIYGEVVDYIRFHVGNWTFPIFNLADSYITVGAVLIFVQEFLFPARQADTDKR